MGIIIKKYFVMSVISKKCAILKTSAVTVVRRVIIEVARQFIVIILIKCFLKTTQSKHFSSCAVPRLVYSIVLFSLLTIKT